MSISPAARTTTMPSPGPGSMAGSQEHATTFRLTGQSLVTGAGLTP